MGGGNMQQMMKQAQKLQEQIGKLQDDLEQRELEAASGGGMVVARVNGKKQLVKLTIKPEAADPEDIEMLEDLVVAAVNEAIRQMDEMAEREMNRLTGGKLGF